MFLRDFDKVRLSNRPVARLIDESLGSANHSAQSRISGAGFDPDRQEAIMVRIVWIVVDDGGES